MTCIVGYCDVDGTVHMGGDSAGINQHEGSISLMKHPKVFTNGDFLIGYTTSFRFGQLLQYAFKPKTPVPSAGLMQFMVTTFVDELRDTLRASGYFAIEGNEFGGVFLVGIRGRLFTVHEDFHVEEHNHYYAAIGGGRPYALGALHAMNALGGDMSADARIGNALRAAAQFSCMVRPPFTVVSSSFSSTETRSLQC